jgi:hypothetical protein
MNDIINKYKKELLDLINYQNELLNIMNKNTDNSLNTVNLIKKSVELINSTEEIYIKNIKNTIKDINKLIELINENNILELKLKNRYV